MDVRSLVRAVASLFGNDTGRDARGTSRRHDHRPLRAPRQHSSAPAPSEHEQALEEDEHESDRSTKFDETLASLIASRQSVLAGSLELIGLDEVRDALGTRWTLFKDAVIKLTQKELDRSLDPSDTFRRHGDVSFLIHFGHLDKDAAEQRARRIANRLRNSLVKTIPELSRAISIRPFVAVVAASEIEQSDKGLTDALFARLTNMRSDAVADLERRRKSLDQNTTILFSPIWSAERELAVLHHCRVNALQHSRIAALWQELVDPEEAASVMAEIDYLAFTKSLEALHRLRRYNRASLLLIPIDMSTILSSTTYREYLRLLGAIPQAYRKYIILELCRVDDDMATDDIYDVIRRFEPHIKGVVVQLALDDKRITEIAASGVWGLSTSISDLDVLDRSVAGSLERFATADGVRGVNTIACGANSIGLAAAALSAGFGFIEGAAISPPAKEPRSAFRLRAQSLSLAQARAPQSPPRTIYEQAIPPGK